MIKLKDLLFEEIKPLSKSEIDKLEKKLKLHKDSPVGKVQKNK